MIGPDASTMDHLLLALCAIGAVSVVLLLWVVRLLVRLFAELRELERTFTRLSVGSSSELAAIMQSLLSALAERRDEPRDSAGRSRREDA